MESTSSIQEQVKEKYGSAARAVTESGNAQACCDPGLRCCNPITSNLYGADQTGAIPEKAVRASLGCGNPTALIDLRPCRSWKELIRTTGFYHNKAKSIQGAARKIIADFGGEVPQTLAELITVPGAARKTANVVLGVSYGKAEGVVVDTHVFRIARRLELAKGDTPQKVEQLYPHGQWREHVVRI